jgi:uncharacterized protein DUF5317
MLVSGIVAGVLVGLATGGNWRRLALFELRWLPLLAIGLGIRASAPLAGAYGVALSVLGLGIVAAVAVVNRHIPGTWLVALGATLNLIVIALNQGMPVDAALAIEAGKPPPNDGLHVAIDSQTRLTLLSDVILLPILNDLYSVGDFLLAVGGFWMTFRVVRSP